jgi:23S rRNA pseudouridine1911/1915/1917 synthase
MGRMVAGRSTRLVVHPEHAGLRLDQFLATATTLSRRRARWLAGEGRVLRDGKPSRVLGRPVTTGDVVDLLVAAEELGVPPRPELPELRIAHRDAWLVAPIKPAGALSQPAERRRAGELALDELLLLRLALETGRRPFLRLIHRLDRGTSGAILFAARPEALGPVAASWRRGEVERRYLAVVEGVPSFERQSVDAPIARASGGSWRFGVEGTGRPAHTELEVLAAGGGIALLACRLRTGRTHQVRVHLSHLGLPVLGDRLYGSRARDPGRPLLHAASLTLPHPRDGSPLHIAAPPPADFTGPLAALGLAAEQL